MVKSRRWWWGIVLGLAAALTLLTVARCRSKRCGLQVNTENSANRGGSLQTRAPGEPARSPEPGMPLAVDDEEQWGSYAIRIVPENLEKMEAWLRSRPVGELSPVGWSERLTVKDEELLRESGKWLAEGQTLPQAELCALVLLGRDRRLSRRLQVVWLLEVVGTDRSIAPLRAILSSQREHSAARAHAVRALGAIGGEEATKVLAIALKDTDANLRYEACWALARARGPSTLTCLRQALGDGSELVREAAGMALKEASCPY